MPCVGRTHYIEVTQCLSSPAPDANGLGEILEEKLAPNHMSIRAFVHERGNPLANVIRPMRHGSDHLHVEVLEGHVRLTLRSGLEMLMRDVKRERKRKHDKDPPKKRQRGQRQRNKYWQAGVKGDFYYTLDQEYPAHIQLSDSIMVEKGSTAVFRQDVLVQMQAGPNGAKLRIFSLDQVDAHHVRHERHERDVGFLYSARVSTVRPTHGGLVNFGGHRIWQPLTGLGCNIDNNCAINSALQILTRALWPLGGAFPLNDLVHPDLFAVMHGIANDADGPVLLRALLRLRFRLAHGDDAWGIHGGFRSGETHDVIEVYARLVDCFIIDSDLRQRICLQYRETSHCTNGECMMETSSHVAVDIGIGIDNMGGDTNVIDGVERNFIPTIANASGCGAEFCGCTERETQRTIQGIVPDYFLVYMQRNAIPQVGTSDAVEADEPPSSNGWTPENTPTKGRKRKLKCPTPSTRKQPPRQAKNAKQVASGKPRQQKANDGTKEDPMWICSDDENAPSQAETWAQAPDQEAAKPVPMDQSRYIVNLGSELVRTQAQTCTRTCMHALACSSMSPCGGVYVDIT